MDFSHAMQPKSDQLNADDLVVSSKIITITGVNVTNSPKQPMTVYYDGDNGRPWKPCKSMMRVMAEIWKTTNSDDLVGKSLELFRDPTARYAGEEVGGIRIARMSHISKKLEIMVSTSRGKRNKFIVSPIHVKQHIQPYPEQQFRESFTAMKEQIESGKMTSEAVITHCEKTGLLTDEQKQMINNLGVK